MVSGAVCATVGSAEPCRLSFLVELFDTPDQTSGPQIGPGLCVNFGQPHRWTHVQPVGGVSLNSVNTVVLVSSCRVNLS